MSLEEVENTSISFLLSQIAVSPLFIFMVIGSVLFLVFMRNEKGCLSSVGKIGSLFYICVYLVALYFYFK